MFQPSLIMTQSRYFAFTLPPCLDSFVAYSISSPIARYLENYTSIPLSSRIPESHSPSANCGYVGNPNSHGLDIRMGYSLQWLATWLSTFFVPQEARHSWCQFNSYRHFRRITHPLHNLLRRLLSDLVIVLTSLAISVYFLHSLSWWSLLFDSNIGGVRKFNLEDNSALGVAIKIDVTFCMACLAIWFLFHGLGTFRVISYIIYVFFFAKADAFGRPELPISYWLIWH